MNPMPLNLDLSRGCRAGLSCRLVTDFQCRSCLAARLSRRVTGVSRAPGGSFLCRRSGWSADGEVLQAGDRGGDLVGPGPSFGEAQPEAAVASDKPPGGGEQAQAKPL